ncbi:MAG TPA: undecaprenyl-phosphate glucose phosphotransferase [Flavisolibacter sp.]|jgi:putative colanic acid biosynthesis UDP-glucose lipid carrier transferase|nr:undecaprenyl-phosphate glucose phosphotransferase [Flavisolibacter sp.]
MNNRFSRLLQFFEITMDFSSLNAVFFITQYLMRNDIVSDTTEYSYFWLWVNTAWLLTSWISHLYSEKVMGSFEMFSRRTMHTYFYWLLLIMMYLFFARKLEISRLFITVVLLSYGIMLLLNRLMFLMVRSYMREKQMFCRKVIIIGYNETAKKLTTYLEDEDNLTEIVGYCEKEENVTELTHYPVLSQLENAMEIAHQYNVEEIYSTIAPEHNFTIYQLMKQAEQACIRFRFIPDLSFFINRTYHVEYMKDIPVLTMRREPLEDSLNRLKKRVLDVVFSALVIVFILSWLIPILGLLIWLESPGPIFFRQMRSGLNNKPFMCIKFRSMRRNKDANLRQATKNDNRLTSIGRFIRKTSLDEFPQFINVFLGDMSIVGPRPHMLKHTDDYSQLLEEYMVRHFAKPGITGWAQVNGFRGETRTVEQMKERVEYDIWYLENWSLWLDVKIIFLTAYNVIRGEKNAF